MFFDRQSGCPKIMSMGTSQTRRIRLGYMYWINGTHWGGWRQPDAPQGGAFSYNYALRAAKTAEDAKFDFFFLGDTLPGDVVSDQWKTTHNTGRLEPFTLGSQLALGTSRIGLAVTAHPTFYDPYILARLTASLDHLSQGRLAWNVVLGASDIAAQNFGLEDLGGASRYERADEFITVVKRLWDSIEDGAYLEDKEAGHYIDDSKIHRLEWRGKHFSVAGTLPLRRPPQGHPPLLYAGGSENSRNLTARHGDINFTGPKTIDQSIEFNKDVRGRAADLGRNPAEIFFLPGISPIIGDTFEEAVAVYDRLNAKIVLDEDPILGGRSHEEWATQVADPLADHRISLPHGNRNLGALSVRVGTDLTRLSLEERVTPEIANEFNDDGNALIERVTDRTGRTIGGPNPIRVSDILYSVIIDHFPLVIGTAEQIADRLQQWFEDGAADGFNVNSPYLWDQFDRFVNQVIPILQSRGIYQTDYADDDVTFRDHFGLPRPRGFYDGPEQEEVGNG